jgi:hypothetical protein
MFVVKSSHRHISAIYVTYIKLGLLQYAFLSSIDGNETSDSYVDFKFTVLDFIKFYVYVVILNKPKT